VGFDGCYQEDFSLLLCDFWDDMNFNNSQNEGGVSFPSGKRPELLLARVLSMFTKKGDLVLEPLFLNTRFLNFEFFNEFSFILKFFKLSSCLT
jgi:hypothetical protein